MKLDTKQQVLLAVYMEYQKDLPDMRSVNNTALNMDIQVFNVALDKLMNEGYITDVFFGIRDGRYRAVTVNMKLTRDGIELIETKFGIQKELTATEKLTYIVKKCGVFGFCALKMFGSDIIKNLI